MNLDQQLTSLEISRKLKELGVKQNSLFSYKRHIPIQGSTYLKPEWKLSFYHYTVDRYESISAFSVAELLEMIPEVKDPYLITFGIEFPHIKMGGRYYASIDALDYPYDKDFYNDNFANCLAELLIYLIENNLVSDEWRKQWLEK